jgi:hypothetical protein
MDTRRSHPLARCRPALAMDRSVGWMPGTPALAAAGKPRHDRDRFARVTSLAPHGGRMPPSPQCTTPRYTTKLLTDKSVVHDLLLELSPTWLQEIGGRGDRGTPGAGGRQELEGRRTGIATLRRSAGRRCNSISWRRSRRPPVAKPGFRPSRPVAKSCSYDGEEAARSASQRFRTAFRRRRSPERGCLFCLGRTHAPNRIGPGAFQIGQHWGSWHRCCRLGTLSPLGNRWMTNRYCVFEQGCTIGGI